MAQHIVVIGAGIVGASCAIELLRDGHRVTLLEPATPGGEQAASYGNGAWISPASVVPMSTPGLWKKVPGYLLDPQGALTIRWQALPALWPWLLRFVRAGATLPRVQATAHALSALLHDAPERHLALATEAGLQHLIAQRGLLYAYPSREAFLAEQLAWRLRRDNGVSWEEWDEATLREQVPPLGSGYTFGAWVARGAHCLDPGAYVAGLVQHATTGGATLTRTRATGFDTSDGRLRAVRTDTGPISCDRAVITAGIASKALAAAAGDRVFLESERGYHVVLTTPGLELPMPVMPSDGRMANTSLHAGLRLSGQVELCATQSPPNWRRADILLGHARRAYPALAAQSNPERQRWMGHRPSTPDGLPIISASRRCSDIVHAFGHGHVGLASGPATGRLVADLMAGRTPYASLAPYAVARFA